MTEDISLECKLHGGRNFFLYGSLVYSKHLEDSAK